MTERIVLAAPRGFCAGVAFAIEVVDLALKIHGAPVYVRHAIVHNEWVVRSFEERGAVFVEDIAEIPEGAVVVFSAHGVSPAVRNEAKSRGLTIIDATCPLVTKVHNSARRFAEKGFLMIYIGHRGHVEAEGTMGEAPDRMILVETPEEAEELKLPPHDKLALVTQTTLSVDEVAAIVTVLERRFPHLERPAKEDICYATTNRQGAVKELAKACDFVIVVGSEQSSNSNRLREVSEVYGAPSVLLMHPSQMKEEWVHQYKTIGITSGASTPEQLVEDVFGQLKEWSPSATFEVLETVKEDVEFRPPRDLIQLALAKG
ncbi:MAG: 4-hydroxy-3-methylbut-2-enyl diphosphate reductase [Fimbriimonadaceae bacterium]|jgi:4-hydroxy-3-methylbut-2-enyl diphosphate reductase|nr:4-hydroxy-3-methylbut-2-enyl diphosphate reductase [Fimbriimonadaceae bacterium]